MKRLFLFAAFVAVFAFLATPAPVLAQNVRVATSTMKPSPGVATYPNPMAPLVRAVLVASDGAPITTLGVTGSVSSGGGGIASLSIGLVAESVSQVATDASTLLSDICSGTAAPFWITLRNVGLTTIHYSPNTPTDSSDGIAAGEQVALYLSTNTPKLNMRANSAGISTLTVNLWK